MRTLAALRTLLPALALALPPSAWAQGGFGPKELGLLVLGQGGGEEWKKFSQALAKSLGAEIPVEVNAGSPGTSDLLRSLEKLKTARVKKIAVVPLYLRSDDPDLEQARYLLGIAQYPSEGVMKGEHSRMGSARIKRALTKIPLSMTQALDEDPAVSQALSERALQMSREPERDAVIVVELGRADDQGSEARLRALQGHAKRVREAGKFRDARAVLLRSDAPKVPGTAPDLGKKIGRGAKESSLRELRDAVRELSSQGRVIAVPCLLAKDGSERRMRKALEGLFHQWKGEALLPSDALASWTLTRMEEARRLPDMIKFRDEGKALPPAPTFKDKK
ncbi:MAG: hypothetical protein AAB576_05460 [Elusimicrobiota bacterium]